MNMIMPSEQNHAIDWNVKVGDQAWFTGADHYLDTKDHIKPQWVRVETIALSNNFGGNPGYLCIIDNTPRWFNACFFYSEAQIKRLRESAEGQSPQDAPNPWKEAVVNALIINCIMSDVHENDPKKAVNDLIDWETKIALDPAVSSEARALIERGNSRSRLFDTLQKLARSFGFSGITDAIINARRTYGGHQS